ncbi:MAG: DEAD/DEAH box helicase [Bacteroidia bacterium]|nr:DEAD/DEAH box helicase [Bacteroidia bacterium]
MTDELRPQQEPDIEVLYEPDNPLPDFTFTDLPAALSSLVQGLGWFTPTPVQRKAIPYVMAGRDIIVQARTGSGKTAAYLLPIIQRIDTTQAWCQALILTPTRELAKQVHDVLMQLVGDSGIRSALVYGGVRYNAQIRDLKEGAHIIVGTPGRVLDHLYRGTLTLMRVKMLVLDEADEMLSMGFYPSMRKLRKQLPEKRHTCMFSATMPYHVEQLAHEFLQNPDRLSLSRGNQSVSQLEHLYYLSPALQKDRVLVRLLEYENPESAIIFTNTKRDAEYLSTFIKNYGIEAQHLTGDLPQSKRERLMDNLRSGELRLLIATDVAARGIDISDLSHVFLYDIPEHVEVYVHRSGRTARAGKTGIAITICEQFQEKKLLGIAKRYGFSIEKSELPSDDALQQRLAERLTVHLEQQMIDLAIMDRERAQRFSSLAETMAQDEDLRPLLAMLLDRSYVQGLHGRVYEGKPRSAATEAVQGTPEGATRDSKKKRKRRGTPRPEDASASETASTVPPGE